MLNISNTLAISDKKLKTYLIFHTRNVIKKGERHVIVVFYDCKVD